MLSSGATVNDDGQVHISLVNVDLESPRAVRIELNSETAAYGLAKAEVITGERKDSYNDFGQSEQVNIQTLPATAYDACGRTLNVTLPAKSIVMLTLNPL